MLQDYGRMAYVAEYPQTTVRRKQRRAWLGSSRLWVGLSLLGLLLVWRGLVAWQQYPAFVLPTPEAVASRWWQELTQGALLQHTSRTLIEALGGFGLAFSASLVLGYILAHWHWLDRIVSPQLAIVQAIPIVAVAPLILIWVGADLRAKLLVAALVTFFPMLSSVIVALRSVPRDIREMAAISGANRWQSLWQIELPLALPGIFGGIKTGLALATTGAVVAEFIGGREGLGALINIARGLFDTPLIFAALLTLGLLTFGFYQLAMWLERRLVTWE